MRTILTPRPLCAQHWLALLLGLTLLSCGPARGGGGGGGDDDDSAGDDDDSAGDDDDAADDDDSTLPDGPSCSSSLSLIHI